LRRADCWEMTRPGGICNRRPPLNGRAGARGSGTRVLDLLVQTYKYLRRRRPARRPQPPSRHAQRTRRRGGPPLSATADRNAGSSSGDDGAGGYTEPVAAVQPPDWNAVWAAPESASTRTSKVGGQRAAYTTRGGGAAPDWLTDPEARQAIADGSAWLERDATGWHLVRAGPDGTTPLVPGDDVDAVLQALEDSRLLGDDEAWRYMQPPPATQRPGRRSRLRYKSA